MIDKIGNPELLNDFIDDIYRQGKKDKKKENLPGYEELSKLYSQMEIKNLKKGEITSAKFMGQTGDFFIFHLPGLKDDIRADYKSNEIKYLKNTEVGTDLDILITDIIDNENFQIRGSISALYESKAHQTLKLLKEGVSVIVDVKSMNPAGYDIEIQHDGVTLPGFMPNTLAGINKLHNPNSIVGQSFDVMIESFSKDEGTYIVSRRKYLQTLIPKAIKQLKHDEVYSGHVTGTTPFGVFIEFNECLTGMIHKANLNPEWQNRISEIKPGFQIEFYVKEVIKDKIILTQILRETLWDNIKIGQVINGRVKDVKQFGTLVHLDEETVGLVHTSEVEKSGRKFQPEQDIKVKVLSVDRLSRKIFLTIA